MIDETIGFCVVLNSRGQFGWSLLSAAIQEGIRERERKKKKNTTYKIENSADNLKWKGKKIINPGARIGQWGGRKQTIIIKIKKNKKRFILLMISVP